jgi:peptide/nickel transport system substrate-binding protein
MIRDNRIFKILCEVKEMKRKKWSFGLFILSLAIMMTLAGCSSSEKADGNGEKGSTLVFARGGDSVSLDPAIVTDGESFKVTQNIFDTLILFGKQNTELEPGLATEWSTSEDGLTYTLKLREGVKFHDGTDFNSEAVKVNFERWKSGNEEKFYYYNSQFGDVIEQINTPDEYTVEFKLKRPLAPFFKNLAMSPFAIASPKALKEQGDKFGDHPVGTGAFKFGEWKRNDRITVTKNEDYWNEGRPKLNEVIFTVIPENSSRLNALKTGEADLIDGVNFSEVESIENDPNLKTFFRPSLNVAYVGLTTTRGPLKDKKVRQALNYAVDKEALLKTFYAGEGQVAANPMPPVVEGYNKDLDPYPYDPKKAKEILKEAGYEDGFEMELWAMPVPRPYMPDGQKIAEAVQSNFADIGVKANIKTYEWATYLEKARLGEADSFLLGWTGDNGDADNFLYVLLDEDAIGSNNYTYYKNPEVHKLLLEAQSTIDKEKRNELYNKAQEIIKDDAPWIPLVHSKPALAGNKTIEGFAPHPTGSDRLDTVEIKQ